MEIKSDSSIYGTNELGFIFVVIIIIIITYAIIKLIFSNNDNSKIDFIRKVRDAMVKQTILIESDINIIKKYSFDHNNRSPHEQFDNWDSDTKVLEKLCSFGFKLLEYYGYNKKPREYLHIVEDIILRIDKALTKVSKLYGLKNNHVIGLSVYPWGNNWYPFSVHVPRLMVMYEYIGDNSCIKTYVCHKNIIRLIPLLNKSLDIFRTEANLAYIAIPRLLTNYLYDRETYEKEKTGMLYKELRNVYHINFSENKDSPQSMHEDGSYVFHKNVATYSYLLTLNNFYEGLFIVIDGESQLRKIVEPLLNKLLHPTIPYVTFGLFGRNGDRINRNWWNIKGKLGLEIIPYIGLLLFKTERFMFSLRIQRPGIAAYETDTICKGEFALGWIQLRKIYLTKRVYPNPLTWEILKYEPGIMSVVGEEFKELLPAQKDRTVESYECEDVENSFIGRLTYPKLIFWRNQYKFDIMYNCFVVEMGVVTHNGFEIYYYIDNGLENRTLQFQVFDKDIKPDDKIKITVEGAEIVDGFIRIDPYQKIEFTWRMLFNDANKTVIEKFNNTHNMTFYYNTNKYVVEPLPHTSKKRGRILYFIVSCFNGDNKLLYVIGGSSNGKINDSMKHGEKILQRDPETLMYLK